MTDIFDKKKLKELQIKLRGGRPRTSTRKITRTSEVGLREGWTRATFIVKEEFLRKIEGVARRDKKLKKDVIDEALAFYLKSKKR